MAEEMYHKGDELGEDDYDRIKADPEGGVWQAVAMTYLCVPVLPVCYCLFSS